MEPTKTNIDANVPLQDWAKPFYNPVAVANTPTLNQTNNQINANLPKAMDLNAPKTMPAGNSLAITPTSLQSVPQVKLPNVQQPTTSAGVIASTQPQTTPSFDTANSNFNQAQTYAGNQADGEQKLMNDLAASLFGQKATAQANQVNLENQAGLLQQQKALGEINTDIATQQNALRGELDRIRNQEGTIGQKQISENTLNDTYGRRLADLAIRQAAANQNITAIQSNAERQTKLLTAPLDTKLDYLKTFGKDNVNYLSEKEKTKLGFIMDDIKTQKASIEALQSAKAKAIAEVASNGGGADQAVIKAIQDATDVTGVSQGAAKYIGLMDRKVQQANIAQSNASTANIYSQISERNREAKAKALESQGGQAIIPGNKPIGKPDAVAAGFANRATEANKIASNVEQVKGKGLTANIFSLRSAMPFAKPEEYKKYEQAEDNFISAVLRKESGASISVEERAAARVQYFAQKGDTPAIVLQKQRNRTDSINALAGAAGTAFGGTFLSKPEEYQGSTFSDINPFSETLQAANQQIYSPTAGYVIPK